MSNQYPPSNNNQRGWGPGNPPGGGPPNNNQPGWGPGNPPGGGPPNGYWNPGTPRRNWFVRHKILTGLGAVLLMGGIGSAVGGGGSTASPGPSSSAEVSSKSSSPTPSASSKAAKSQASTSSASAKKSTRAPKKLPGLNTAVKDGDLEFVVTKVQTGVAQIGGQYLNQKAQGKYTLVSITIKNVGDKSETFSGSDQKIKDSQGRTFSSDSAAGIYLEDNDVLFNEVNPGNTARGVLAFDMPAGSTPVSMTLKGFSLFSSGTTVSLN